jgi:hypothetical protein
MKHQNLDSNLIGYNDQFEIDGIFSWILKDLMLINVAPASLATPSGVGLNSYSTASITGRLTGRFRAT